MEGNASSVALLERLGKSPTDTDVLKNLNDDDEVFEHCANALANLCASLILLVSAERIVLSGGIMLRKCLFEMVRKRTREILNGYIAVERVTDEVRMRDLIVESVWGNEAGIVGALSLAVSAYEEANEEKTVPNPNNKWLWAGTGIAVGALCSTMLARILKKQ